MSDDALIRCGVALGIAAAVIVILIPIALSGPPFPLCGRCKDPLAPARSDPVNWPAIIAAILRLVGPLLSELLREWLDDRLRAAAERLPDPLGHRALDAHALLAEVYGSLWFFQVAKKRLVRELIRTTPRAVAAGLTSLHDADRVSVRMAAQAAE